MTKLYLVSSTSIILVIGAMLAGCSKPQPASSPAASQDRSTMTDHSGHEGHDQESHADHAGHSRYDEALAELSPEDRALAEKQKTCPVSGEPLGKMGKPYKVTVQGREVLLCCPGCESKIKENPEEYLAKLPQ